MRFGDREIEVGVIDATTTLRLTKFVAALWEEIQEDQKQQLGEALQKGALKSLLNILGTQHLYKLTGIFLDLPQKEVQESWNILNFTEMLADISEKNDVPQLLKNLQRVVAAFEL